MDNTHIDNFEANNDGVRARRLSSSSSSIPLRKTKQ